MHISGPYSKIEFNTNIFVNEDETFRELKDWKERLLAIIQQLPAKADTIKPIIQLLVMAIAPTKIYMLDHRNIVSQPTPEYIDLLLVIPSNNSTPFTELEPILEIPYLKDSRVACSLHNEGIVMEGLRTGHIFYSLNFTRENLIYDDEAIDYPIPSIETVQEMEERAKAVFLQHFERAEDFYDCAEFLYQRRPAQIIAFLLHQAIEFSYRGVLLSLNGYDKRTHEIQTLKKHTRRCAPQLSTIFSSDPEEEKRLTELLNNAYLAARYDGNYTVNEIELSVIFEKVKLLQDTCKELVETKTNHSILE